MTIKIDLTKLVTAETRTAEQIAKEIAVLKLAMNKHLDSFAADAGYDSIVTMATYAFSSIPDFQKEGQKAVEYRDKCWQVFIDLTKDTSKLPSAEELVAALPAPV